MSPGGGELPLMLLTLLSLPRPAAARKEWNLAEPDGRPPNRSPTDREVADSGVRRSEAERMPWFPTHEVQCGGSPCRPGEGNLKHRREDSPRGWRYKQWTQPYIHREAWVQSRSRQIPHWPDPQGHYDGLVRVAMGVAVGNLVLVTSGDWDYREIVLNWVLHARQLGYTNALVLAMDRELFNSLQRRRVPAFDNSALVHVWNDTCLQRHIQRVRMERHIGVAALLAAGLDVLHTDATCVFVRDFVPMLRAQPAAVDMLAQRDDWPSDPIRKVGSSANAGLVYMRGSKKAAIATLVMDMVKRGLIEFYLRWNNIPDQYGWSFVMAQARFPVATTTNANETTVGLLHPRGSHCKQTDTCLTVGFLPYHLFPRTGRWEAVRATAAVYHLTFTCRQEDAPCFMPGLRPFRGHRQRLDRYDDVDFEDMRQTLKSLGLWLVDDAAAKQRASLQELR